MEIRELLQAECVVLDAKAASREEAWGILAGALAQSGAVKDAAVYLQAVAAREAQGSTGVGFGIAIPHAKSAAVARPALAMGRFSPALDVQALDGEPADLMFLIAAPEGADEVHLKALAKLARMLMHEAFRADLRQAPDAAAVLAAISRHS